MTTNRGRATRLRACVVALGVTLALLAHSTPSFSTDKPLRDHYALIRVTVWTPTNQAAYGIRVDLRSATGKKTLQQSISNHAGEVAFRVPEGKADYIVLADVKPSKGKTKPTLTVHIEKDEVADVSLHLIE